MKGDTNVCGTPSGMTEPEAVFPCLYTWCENCLYRDPVDRPCVARFTCLAGEKRLVVVLLCGAVSRTRTRRI